jgi:hypothetical protein
MKNPRYLIVLAISLAFFSCASTQNQTLNDGSSMEKAIKVGSVEQEYKIVREKCGDCTMKSQSLTFNDKDKPFDVLTFIKPNGEEVKYYFDISKFYGNF